MGFKDLFSVQAAQYAQFRPHYPRELFAWVASLPPQRRLAVDVGTGNGQAAVALASRFDSVIGVDPSAQQIASAPTAPGFCG
jgi:trans-aconitate methyltransferase